MIGGYDRLHQALNLIFLIGICHVHEVFQLFEEGVTVEGDGLSDVDEIIVCLQQALFSHEFFFIQFLAGSESGVFNADVHIRLVARETDQVAGKLIDLHGTAHIKDEDFSAVGIGAGQQDQTHRLGDGHEIADDIRVGHCDRSAVGDLLPEQGDHGAVAAEHIAETDRDKFGADIFEDLSCAVPVRVLDSGMGE